MTAIENCSGDSVTTAGTSQFTVQVCVFIISVCLSVSCLCLSLVCLSVFQSVSCLSVCQSGAMHAYRPRLRSDEFWHFRSVLVYGYTVIQLNIQ